MLKDVEMCGSQNLWATSGWRDGDTGGALGLMCTNALKQWRQKCPGEVTGCIPWFCGLRPWRELKRRPDELSRWSSVCTKWQRPCDRRDPCALHILMQLHFGDFCEILWILILCLLWALSILELDHERIFMILQRSHANALIFVLELCFLVLIEFMVPFLVLVPRCLERIATVEFIWTSAIWGWDLWHLRESARLVWISSVAGASVQGKHYPVFVMFENDISWHFLGIKSTNIIKHQKNEQTSTILHQTSTSSNRI
jgi:hypothetical protein